MKLLATFILLLCAAWSTRESEIRESAITFRIQNAGITVNGTFEGLEADVQFDPDRLGNADIRASVPVSSIRTGIVLRDKHLQRPDYFHSEQFPRITLASKTIRRTGRGRYEGLFDLNIKGIEREVKIPFTYSADNTFGGSFRLNRLDFELGQSSLVLADEVEVQILVKLAARTLSKS
ncbi:YceI family protein [Spirosoma taeanense]|uniref:YceI family protein n=1 Tax=Spirosoma taeanense TaxID=2735870 RepID=A0A6M5YA71_9BACT|nr:YceI family protein [Spirosoma taeanense]QJW90865.1 YceI family protein [Spirosoma taeanense]